MFIPFAKLHIAIFHDSTVLYQNHFWQSAACCIIHVLYHPRCSCAQFRLLKEVTQSMCNSTNGYAVVQYTTLKQ
jgi:hypothetical protein